MNAGDWVLIRARVVGQERRSDAVRLVAPSGLPITVMLTDIRGAAGRPQIDWDTVRMGQRVLVAGRGEGRFITRQEREGVWFISVLPADGEPRWVQQEAVTLA